jgi:hypothetical protein
MGFTFEQETAPYYDVYNIGYIPQYPLIDKCKSQQYLRDYTQDGYGRIQKGSIRTYPFQNKVHCKNQYGTAYKHKRSLPPIQFPDFHLAVAFRLVLYSPGTSSMPLPESYYLHWKIEKSM